MLYSETPSESYSGRFIEQHHWEKNLVTCVICNMWRRKIDFKVLLAFAVLKSTVS